jgi:succinate-semialdehyde dehydrogenase/glutarate-semialdehyde dehydrogenase
MGTMPIRSVNPATGETIEEFAAVSPADVDRALAAADGAYRAHRHLSPDQRAGWLRAAAGVLRADRARLARTAALEMGKPTAQGEAEIEKCAKGCEHYAEKGPAYLADEPREVEGATASVRYAPLGVVLAIMPWNFPFWQVFRFAAPALLAGNAAVLKHAPNVPRCALEVEDVWRRAGVPKGLFQTLLAEVDVVPRMLGDPRVVAVTLTGSDRAGADVASKAGAALKKCVLELGGSDPFVVLEDADLDEAAKTAVEARLQNSGQSCIAAKRFVVVKTVLDEFVSRFTRLAAAKRTGDPLLPGTDLGPQARLDLRLSLAKQVDRTVARGARVALGGRMPSGPGAFYPPTVLVGVEPGMSAFDEETFGPVAAVVSAKDEDEAIRLANATSYGLGASLWTKDLDRARRLIPRIEAGAVFVNAMVRSDPRLPFGGVKRSGYGRELSEHGAREFTNVQTVWIA